MWPPNITTKLKTIFYGRRLNRVPPCVHKAIDIKSKQKNKRLVQEPKSNGMIKTQTTKKRIW